MEFDLLRRFCDASESDSLVESKQSFALLERVILVAVRVWRGCLFWGEEICLITLRRERQAVLFRWVMSEAEMESF